MLDYSEIRDLYKDADRINSEHLVVAEWNMNKYIPIKEYGIYKGFPGSTQVGFGVTDAYIENDTNNVFLGKNYLVYDDGSKEVDPSQEFFSDLASIFKPERPNPGIILLQKFGGMTFVPTYSNIKVSNLSTNNARYYPISDNRSYDYFNSAKLIDLKPISAGEENFNLYADALYGISDPGTGKIAHSNAFIVYEGDPIFCNKITIKVQNHLSVPEIFRVQVLLGSTWTNVYSSTSSSDFSDGILDIYYNAGTWSKTVSRISDLNQLTAASPTELQKIRGIRFLVEKLTLVKSKNAPEKIQYSPGSLELIEISPRLEIDLTTYTEQFSFASSIGDSTNFGLPVGSIVSGTGAISLSNEEDQFFLSSTLSSLRMLNQDVKFSFYQKVFVPSENQTFTIPLKVLYSKQWNVGQNYSVSINLEDGMKFLREVKAPDILFSSNAAMSAIILILLDNVGITGLEFKKSSDAVIYDKEDVKIKNFFCKKEQTVAQVLEQIAIATQCSIFYDASGKLNVLTKEKISKNVDNAASSSSEESKTDFWFIGSENYAGEAENSFINNYTANIISLKEEKIDPITDGDIIYHTYGPSKSALAASLQKEKDAIEEQIRLDQLPNQSLAFANYGYTTTILWSPEQSNDSVLGAANVSENIPALNLKDVFTGSYTAVDEDNLIRYLYTLTNNSSLFPTEALRSQAKRSLIIYLDTNEGTAITPFEGIVLIDKEYIKYRGKLYYIASKNPTLSGFRLVFTRNEFDQIVAGIQKGDSIAFRGLVVEAKTKILNKIGSQYQYKIIDDGRGYFKSKITQHFSLAEDSDGIEPENRFKLMLGSNKSQSNYMAGDLSATTKFNFLDKVRYKSARKALGTLSPESLQSYLGFLHVSGPTAPKEETDILLSILDPNKSKTVSDRLQKMNEQVDSDVPGDFDSYIYMQGEKNIYGQKIPLGFEPNAISTRMRLYSPRRLIKSQRELMSTNSSIAGIGFGLNNNNEGYFLEVESVGSGKFNVEKEAYKNNLRFYKVSLETKKDGKVVYKPSVLIEGSVYAFTTSDTGLDVIKSDDISTDAVFELDILIKRHKDKIEFTVLYGGQKVGDHSEKLKNGQRDNSSVRNMFLFVRNDSQAIYEYVMAAARPSAQSTFKKNEKDWFKNYKYFNNQLEKGVIPVGKTFMFKDDNKGLRFYFNDFARLAREVKEYNIRFSSPAYGSSIVDISKINPKYFIKKYESTSFGAKLILVNSSGSSITLGKDSNLPLYIVGIALEEINSGTISMKNIYDVTQDDKKRITEREMNISIYGSQTFTLDSQYIQSISYAKNLMRWVIGHCGRPRMKLTIETFSNPLIELGDKVKVFDKNRQYRQNNIKFGDRTFVVSSISHSVSTSGPIMNLSLTEVGE